MGKYYKKPRKHSYKFYKGKVPLPDNHKLYNGWARHISRRKYKRYEKYAYHNEDLMMALLLSNAYKYKEYTKSRWRAFMSAEEGVYNQKRE